jgi:erythrocyte band 7 integral membrane protein
VSDVVQVIASEGELKASRALKEAADVIQESPSALQVLYILKGTVTQDKINLFKT